MLSRGRPKKYRIIRTDPKIKHFSPRGAPGRPDEIILSMDQFEALRLSDSVGLNQKEAAKSMHISQQTFSRILKRGRRALTEGLICGASIKIQGGYYVISSREQNEKVR